MKSRDEVLEVAMLIERYSGCDFPLSHSQRENLTEVAQWLRDSLAETEQLVETLEQLTSGGLVTESEPGLVSAPPE